MAIRELSNAEIVQSLTDHVDIASLVQQHEARFGYAGSQQWNQILLSQSVDVPIPPRGITFEDSYYGHVIVFPDVNGILHFVVTDNDSLAKEIAKPVYVSDPDYWQLFDTIVKKYEAVGSGVLSTTTISSIALLGTAVIVGILVLKK